mgnify:CR=1 FL=1
MAQFIFDQDYQVLVRTEIMGVLSEDYTPTKLLRAEEMAISQMRNYLHSRYDLDKVFSVGDLAETNAGFDLRAFSEPDYELSVLSGTDERNAHIVMLVIDCALYHLYSSLAPNLMPEHRSQRYEDALNWLKSIAKGDFIADLPLTEDADGNSAPEIRMGSKYSPSNQRW